MQEDGGALGGGGVAKPEGHNSTKTEAAVVLRTPPTSPASPALDFSLKKPFFQHLSSVCCKTKCPLGGSMVQDMNLITR